MTLNEAAATLRCGRDNKRQGRVNRAGGCRVMNFEEGTKERKKEKGKKRIRSAVIKNLSSKFDN